VAVAMAMWQYSIWPGVDMQAMAWHGHGHGHAMACPRPPSRRSNYPIWHPSG